MKWLADENLRNAIVRGLLRRNPQFDIVRAQDIPAICGTEDLILLRFAAVEDRVVVTHDVSTMLPAMRLQTAEGPRSARVVLVPDSLPVQAAIEDLLLLDECAQEPDWAAGLVYIPLR